MTTSTRRTMLRAAGIPLGIVSPGAFATNHTQWAKDIEETRGHAGDSADGRTAADNATVRSVFAIEPDKKIKAMLTYQMSTGRNFDEVQRLVRSYQLTAKHAVAKPANWQPGQDVIIPPAVSDEVVKQKFPNGWSTVKSCLRVVA